MWLTNKVEKRGLMPRRMRDKQLILIRFISQRQLTTMSIKMTDNEKVYLKFCRKLTTNIIAGLLSCSLNALKALNNRIALRYTRSNEKTH